MIEYDNDIFNKFGFVIYDECHHLGAETFSKALLKTTFNYTLGLSATPKRADGLSKVFKWFIGPVIHKEKSDLTVNVLVKCIYYENQELFDNIPLDFRGNPIYSTLISKICGCKDRTDLIISIVKKELLLNKEQQIMILAHNKSLIQELFNGIVLFEKSIGYYLGGMKDKDLKNSETKKIIIGTYAMASEGLDIKTLTSLIMATPKSDVCQSVGRILRSKHSKPLVIDIIDSNSIFQNQFKKREKYYKSKKYSIEFYSNIKNYLK